MKQKTTLLAIALTAMSIASCQQEDATTGDALPEGKYPLQIASVAIGGDTRVSETSATKCEFVSGDAIGVRVGTNGNSGKYAIGESGSVTVVSPAYWQSTGKATVTAWYPVDEAISLGDQSSSLAYVMKAEAANAAFNSTPSLSFNHQLSKIRVKLTGITNAVSSVSSVYVKTYTVCTNNKGTVNTDGASDGYVKMLKTTYDDGETYWEANVVPGYKIEYVKLNDKECQLTTAVMPEAGKYHDITVNINSVTVSLNGLTQSYTISEGGTYTFTGTISDHGIQVTGGNPTIILNNATINRGQYGSCIWGTSYTLVLKGKNKVTTTDQVGAVTVNKGETLTIEGDGSLTAESYYNDGSAGIGGGYENKPCGNIIINSGKVTAICSGGAGIGGGCYNSSCGNITITGGEITASVIEYGGAGIGGGYDNSPCGNITITGGTIKATSTDGAGIGGGYSDSGCGDIIITGGTITATGSNSDAIGNGYIDSNCSSTTIKNATVNGVEY